MSHQDGQLLSQAILVVDDERLIRWMVRETLAREGYRVVEAGDAGEALAVFAADPALSAVLLDLKLPDGDGITVLRAMKASRPECQVIIMTAHGSPDDEQAATAAGAFRFILKPFDQRFMLQSLREALAA